MSDDRFSDENNPPVSKLLPCRRYVEQPRDEVSAEEMFEWLDDFERWTGTGKHRPKKQKQPMFQAATDGSEGRFGTDDEGSV